MKTIIISNLPYIGLFLFVLIALSIIVYSAIYPMFKKSNLRYK